MADTVLKPLMKNKKTVSRPAERDFKDTNVRMRDPLFSLYLHPANMTCNFSIFDSSNVIMT